MNWNVQQIWKHFEKNKILKIWNCLKTSKMMFFGPPQAKIFGVPDRLLRNPPFLRNPPLFVPDLQQGGGFLKYSIGDRKFLGHFPLFCFKNPFWNTVFAIENAFLEVQNRQIFRLRRALAPTVVIDLSIKQYLWLVIDHWAYKKYKNTKNMIPSNCLKPSKMVFLARRRRFFFWAQNRLF